MATITLCDDVSPKHSCSVDRDFSSKLNAVRIVSKNINIRICSFDQNFNLAQFYQYSGDEF